MSIPELKAPGFKTDALRRPWAALLASGLLLLGLAACKHQPNAQDAQITSAVQNQIAADPALQGQQVRVATQNGVVTLSGTTATEAQRVAAARDAQVPGVSQVVNQIATTSTDNGATASFAGAGSNAGASAPSPRRRERGRSSPSDNAFPASGSSRHLAGSQRVPPVEVPAGTVLPVRIDQTLASDMNHPGETFKGEIAKPVAVNGIIAIPAGAAVTGTIVQVDNAGHFKGRSAVVIQVSSISYNGHSYSVASNDYTRVSATLGKRSAEMIGGGAGLGALIGAIAGHGKGALIGAAAGAGAGTAAQVMTHPPVAKIPAETVVNFRLTSALQVTPASGTL